MLLSLTVSVFILVLGYGWHRYRLKTYEQQWTARIAGEMADHQAARDAAEKVAAEMTGMDRAKSEILRHLINELRTPLTLLMTPLQRVGQYAGSLYADDLDVDHMLRSTRRLSYQVDQLHDVLDLEVGDRTLQTQEVDLVSILRHQAVALRPTAERNGVDLIFETDIDAVWFEADVDKMEVALQGLIQWFFQDTVSGDVVRIQVTWQAPDGASPERLAVVIEDSHRKMEPAALRLLNENVHWSHQADAIVDVMGLGLALARSYVTLHGGQIHAVNAGDGTRVEVTLPAGYEAAKGPSQHRETQGLRVEEEEALVALLQGDAFDKPVTPSLGAGDGVKQSTVLVVDDHAGIRGYLSFALRKQHHVLEAANGQEALEIIRRDQPDLVISDVVMPIMDGEALCRAVKEDETLNHIPVVLVTANKVEGGRKDGLELGADDYLYKPFDLEEAMVRIDNLIRSRGELRRRFSREVVVKPSDITITSAEEAFLERAMEIVEENMDNGNFGVQELAADLGLSPRQLQRKLRETVDQSPVEFIRLLRLQRAAQLLEQQAGNISEVAYAVGFTSLSYFAKCFREQYGTAPSEYRSEQMTA